MSRNPRMLVTGHPLRSSALVATLLLAGCMASRVSHLETSRPACVPGSQAVLAESLNRTEQSRRALDRIQQAHGCGCRKPTATCTQLLAEARHLVARAKVAPPSEQPALERRAAELIQQLQGR